MEVLVAHDIVVSLNVAVDKELVRDGVLRPSRPKLDILKAFHHLGQVRQIFHLIFMFNSFPKLSLFFGSLELLQFRVRCCRSTALELLFDEAVLRS